MGRVGGRGWGEGIGMRGLGIGGWERDSGKRDFGKHKEKGIGERVPSGKGFPGRTTRLKKKTG